MNYGKVKNIKNQPLLCSALRVAGVLKHESLSGDRMKFEER
jgi:hypothetical protein